MLNNFRGKIESKRNSNNFFWRMIILFKGFLAKIFKGTESEYSRIKREKIFYSQFIKNGDMVFDIGANHGQKTKVFLALGASVTAIEPQAECAKDLMDQFKSNDKVQIIKKGLAAEEGKQLMHISQKSDMVSTFSTEWQTGRFENTINWDKTTEIEMTTVEKIIEQVGIPQFCKIDVEGFEVEVIKGFKSKVPAVGFEFAEEFIENTIKSIELLSDIGFTTFNFSASESYILELSKWMNKDEFISHLNTITDTQRKDLWGDIYAK